MTAQIQQWEYRVEKIGSWRGVKQEDIQSSLDEWGMDGWEVFSLVTSPEGAMWVTAKKPLDADAARSRRRAASLY